MKKIFEIIGAILLGSGFEKNGNSFIRHLGKHIQIIDIQKYSYKVDENISFTINVGIILPDIFLQVFNKETSLKYYEGVFISNAGEIHNNFTGKISAISFEIDSPLTIIPEIESLITHDVLPFLNSVKSNEEIINFYSKNALFFKKQPFSVKEQFNLLEK